MNEYGIDATVTVTQASRTASRVIEGKAVVIVIDRRKLHTLNPVGTRIWELADGRSLGDIATALEAEFDVDRERALADVGRFVAELVRVGALEAK